MLGPNINRGLGATSIDEWWLTGAAGGYTNLGERRYGFIVSAMGPQTRDLYNLQTSFYDPERFGGGLGPVVTEGPATSVFSEPVPSHPVDPEMPVYYTTGTETTGNGAPTAPATEKQDWTLPILIVLGIFLLS